MQEAAFTKNTTPLTTSGTPNLADERGAMVLYGIPMEVKIGLIMGNLLCEWCGEAL